MKERLESILAELLMTQNNMVGYNTPIEAEIYEKVVGAISKCRSGLRDLEDKSKNLSLFTE